MAISIATAAHGIVHAMPIAIVHSRPVTVRARSRSEIRPPTRMPLSPPHKASDEQRGRRAVGHVLVALDEKLT